MQSQYPNPHQLAAAAAAAAGLQRLPYASPVPGGAPNSMASRMSLMQSLNGPREPGSGRLRQELIAESGNDDDVSEVESEMASENDDDGSNINSKVLDTSCKEMLERLNHRSNNTDEEAEKTEAELKGAQSEEAHDLSHCSRFDSHCSSDTEFEKITGQSEGERETDRPTQMEIKTQRPLGLLAQHGLTAKLGSSKSHAGSLLPITDQLNSHTRHRKREADEQLQQQQRQLDNGRLVDGGTWKSEVNGLEKERLGELDFGSHLLLMDRRFMPSPPPSASPLTPDPNKSISTPSGHHWTFEEQFKQLYEMSLEPKRKEFLDDLFSFMQKRGTPVNRIPIMAKQTLDLYELFRLVVSKGGLVEVINKKLWREITKGLNLPSSITSAAFTLRTQYMKYLYPYECDKLKLSTLAELQSAIDGNRREGRRPGYGYDFSPLPAMLPTPPGSHLNVPLHPLNSGRPSSKDDDLSLLTPSHNHLRSLAEHDAQAMEAAARAMEEVSKRIEASRVGVASSVMTSMSNLSSVMNVSTKFDDTPPCKRPAMLDDDRFLAHMGMHSAHIKMTNQSNGRLEYESPMVVNMEINGMMYQGVLFAQHPRRI